MDAVAPRFSRADRCAIPEMLYFAYSVSFVAHAWAVRVLHRAGLFTKVAVNDTDEDMATERLIAVAAELILAVRLLFFQSLYIAC